MLHLYPLKRLTSSSVNPKSGTSSLGDVHVSSASACAMLCDHFGSTLAIHHTYTTTTYAPVKPWELAPILFCNVPPLWGQARLHQVAFLGHRLPSQTNTSLFYIICPHSCAPRKNFPVGHLNSLGQPCLTLEFFGDGLPEKKLQLVDMSILLILLSPRLRCYSCSRVTRSSPPHSPMN